MLPKNAKERLYLMAAGFTALIVLVIGWFFFVSPQRDQTSQVDAQVATARTQNNTLQARITQVQTENKDLKKFQNALALSQLALPATDGIPNFLRSLQALGSATGTNVTALTVGTPIGAQLATPGTSTPSATPSSSPALGAGAGSGVYALPITAQVTGDPTALGKFLGQLQSVQPRAVLITQISQTNTVGTATNATELQLTMQAFVDPSTAIKAAVPTPSASH